MESNKERKLTLADDAISVRSSQRRHIALFVSDNFLNNSKKVLRNIFKSKCRDRETEKEPIYVTIPNEQIKL